MYSNTAQSSASRRYDTVDAIRGITIISMVLFHFCYDVFMVFGRDPSWYSRPASRLWQQSICWSFILISGFVWSWGQKNALRRGILINLCGFLVTAVTLLAFPSEAIWFGVLNFLGCAVLLMIPLRPAAEKIPPYAGLAVCFLLFLFFRNLQAGFVGFGSRLSFRVPDVLYNIKVLTPLGFPFPAFYSSDYFPILPWFFLYLCGWFMNRIFLRHPSWQHALQHRVPLLTPLGKKSLWIYLLHQPVCYLICLLFFSA